MAISRPSWLTAIAVGAELTQPRFAVVDEPPRAVPRSGANGGDHRLTPDELAQWRDAAAFLRQMLTDGINVRAAALGRTPNVRSVREKLEQFRGYRESARRLTDLLGEMTPCTVLTEIEEIGREVCRDAWPLPPIPAEEPEP